MGEQMLRQMSSLSECLLTGPTLVELLSTMGEQMLLQMSSLSECLLTGPTLV